MSGEVRGGGRELLPRLYAGAEHHVRRVWESDEGERDQGERAGAGGELRSGDESRGVHGRQTGTYYYFGGRMVKNGSAWVYGDRLGSIGKYYPYGQERPSATQNGTEKFTGYLRDAETGLDYADQRYEQPGMGRFLTADRMRGQPSDPGSWNKYAYAGEDPINDRDPRGNYYCKIGSGERSEGTDCEDYTVYAGPVDPQCALLNQLGMAGNPAAADLVNRVCPSGWHVAPDPAPPPQAQPNPVPDRWIADVAVARAGVVSLLSANPDCDNAIGFGETSLGADVAATVPIVFSNLGALNATTDANGSIVSVSGAIAQGPLGTTLGPLELNAVVNWSNPSQTLAVNQLQAAVPYDLLAAEEARVGTATMTSLEFMELTILHEMGHGAGLDHPRGDSSDYNKAIWDTCLR